MTASETYKETSENPAGVIKSVLALIIVVIILFIAFKFLKGLGKFGTLLSEFGPATEEEKRQTIEDPAYQDNLKWLDDRSGIVAMVKAGYKNSTSYLTAKGLTQASLDNVATRIWDAKWPGYISETEVYNAIATLPSKAAISLMALQFNVQFKNKIGFYPLDVFLDKYLKLDEMKTLTEIISKKPTT